jgi:hypothetical protein
MSFETDAGIASYGGRNKSWREHTKREGLVRTYSWLLRRLEARRAGHVIIMLALLLGLPSMASPLVMDEYAQLIHFRASKREDGPSFLVTAFVFAQPESNRWEMEHGTGVWWTAPGLKIAFFRPLAAATQALDFSLWPRSPALMHVHTLLWFAALLAASRALFSRLLPSTWTANLALALYALDDARGQVLSWVANRHAIIGGLFGCLTWLVYDKWRRDGWGRGVWLGPVLFALALLSSEMALATSAYLLGYALFIDAGPLGRRLVRLWPYALVVISWQLMYSLSGFGVEGSGAYLHPLHEPWAYVRHLPARALVLLLGQLTPLPGDAWLYLPPHARITYAVFAALVIVIIGCATLPLLAARRQAGFWLLGSLLSLLPIAAIGPSDRNLVFVGFGMAGALALGVQTMLEAPVARWRRLMMSTLLFCNLALAALFLPLKSLYMLALQSALAPSEASIPRDETVADKTLVVVTTASEGPIGVTWWQRDALAIAKPRAARILVATFGETSIQRLDASTLRLHRDLGFFESEMHELARGRSIPFHRGDVVALSDLTVTVVDITEDARPRTLEFHFARPLDAPDWLWMRGSGTRFVTWTPPRVGETVSLGVTS